MADIETKWSINRKWHPLALPPKFPRWRSVPRQHARRQPSTLARHFSNNIADTFTINHRRTSANLSPRIRIHNRLTILREAIRRVVGAGDAGPEFSRPWLHFIRGSVQ
jgi:hypothetical protein